MKTIEKVVEQKVMFYVATDGNMFRTEKECKDYENELVRKSHIAEAEKLRVPELDDVMPLLTDGGNPNHSFRWYKLESERDFETLRRACDIDGYGHIYEPSSYPELYCVEFFDSGDPYLDEPYGVELQECREDTLRFWTQMGYKITLEKM